MSAFSSNDCTSLYLFLLFREFGFAAEDFLRRGFGLRPPFGKNLFRSLSATPLFRALEEAYPPCTPRKKHNNKRYKSVTTARSGILHTAMSTRRHAGFSISGCFFLFSKSLVTRGSLVSKNQDLTLGVLHECRIAQKATHPTHLHNFLRAHHVSFPPHKPF